MTFSTNLLLRVRLSKISLFCTKVGEGLYRSLLAEADFLSSAIYSSEWFQVRHRKAIFRNKRQNVFARFFCLFCSADILSLKLTSERVLSIRLSR